MIARHQRFAQQAVVTELNDVPFPLFFNYIQGTVCDHLNVKVLSIKLPLDVKEKRLIELADDGHCHYALAVHIRYPYPEGERALYCTTGQRLLNYSSTSAAACWLVYYYYLRFF
jgi:hypothetical protein